MWTRVRRLLGLSREKPLPPADRGDAVLRHLGAATIIVDWAATRRGREDPVDLLALWNSCPRADWLLRMAHAAGVEESLIRTVANEVRDSDQPDDSVGLDALLDELGDFLDRRLAADAALQNAKAEEEELAGSRTDMARDKMYSLRLKVDALTNKLNEPLCQRVRKRIDYDRLHGAIYGASGSPYR